MNKKQTLNLLTQHRPFDETETGFLAETIRFVEQHEDFWQRTTREGHLTGSAWVLSPDRSQVLLIHHTKLDRWFQPGGHAGDTDDSLLETARREAMEECGLPELQHVQEEIFDIDVHPIPEKGAEPAHLHYDIRFLFRVENRNNHARDETETKGMKWVNLAELTKKNVPSSLRRMAHKLTQ
jgi:8-oxo-dGTP pyrophosphatase MutT (NUDIX family)